MADVMDVKVTEIFNDEVDTIEPPWVWLKSGGVGMFLPCALGISDFKDTNGNSKSKA